jgi:predicted transcriptional regulator
MKILLSIKPEYAERILDGTKKYEFRKRVHTNPLVRTVVIYATMPVGKVVGEFSIEQVHAETPKHLWAKTKFASGITQSFFADYFSGRDIAYAIEVKKVKRYATPKRIKDFLPSGVAPQSYAYIENVSHGL